MNDEPAKKTLEDKTDIYRKSTQEGTPSHFFNVSVRGWLAIFIIGGICFSFIAHVLAAVSVMIFSENKAIWDSEMMKLQQSTMKDLGLIALGYYFSKTEQEYIRGKKKEDTNDKSTTI